MKISTLRVLTIVITYIFSKIVSYQTGVSYNIFSDRFDLTKCIIDLVIFACCYTIVDFSLKYLFKDTQRN